MYNVQISRWSKVKAPFCVALLGPVPRTSLNQIEAECQKKCFEAEIFVITQTTNFENFKNNSSEYMPSHSQQ